MVFLLTFGLPPFSNTFAYIETDSFPGAFSIFGIDHSVDNFPFSSRDDSEMES